MPSDFNWGELLKLLPLVAGSVNPLAGVIAQQIMKVAEREIQDRQQSEPDKTRDEIIAEAGAKFDEGIAKAEALRRKGHEGDENVTETYRSDNSRPNDLQDQNIV